MYFYPITPEKKEWLAKQALIKAEEEKQKSESDLAAEAPVQEEMSPSSVATLA